MKRVAINGFGRIGRAYFRLAHLSKDIEVVAINDLVDIETGVYMLEHDSVYGSFPEEITIDKDTVNIRNKKIRWLSVKNPTELPWKSMDIDVVIESTGTFSSYEKAYLHTVAGAKHVIISAPAKGPAPENVSAGTVLIGVNSEKVKKCSITSNASCTTNAVGLPIDILDKKLGVKSAILNTIHGYTSSQSLVDSPTSKMNMLRLGRAAAINIVPSTTGAASTTTKVVESLKNKFDGISLRVPVPVGSIVDLTFISKKDTTIDEVNSILKGCKCPLFTTTTEPVVSSDIVGMPFVSIADLSMTRVVDGNLVKILLWYDNEIGYCQSLIEHTKEI